MEKSPEIISQTINPLFIEFQMKILGYAENDSPATFYLSYPLIDEFILRENQINEGTTFAFPLYHIPHLEKYKGKRYEELFSLINLVSAVDIINQTQEPGYQ